MSIVGVLIAVGRRWRALSEKERRRLVGLVREAGVRPDRLSPRERRELRKLLAKLDLRGIGRDVGRLARKASKRGRWRSS